MGAGGLRKSIGGGSSFGGLRDRDEGSSISRIQKGLKESQMRVDTSLGRSID